MIKHLLQFFGCSCTLFVEEFLLTENQKFRSRKFHETVLLINGLVEFDANPKKGLKI